MVNKRKLAKAILKSDKKNLDTLYLNYITALIKSENLQNKLEKTCSILINTPASLITNNVSDINNNLNNLLVKLMLMQNTIDYFTSIKG